MIISLTAARLDHGPNIWHINPPFIEKPFTTSPTINRMIKERKLALSRLLIHWSVPKLGWLLFTPVCLCCLPLPWSAHGCRMSTITNMKSNSDWFLLLWPGSQSRHIIPWVGSSARAQSGHLLERPSSLSHQPEKPCWWVFEGGPSQLLPCSCETSYLERLVLPREDGAVLFWLAF